jgi:hypothetical protein
MASMMDKSYVTLEQHRCIICGEDFDTGALLLDRRLREKFDTKTVTGMGMCPEHQKLYDDGYVALIEADNTPAGSTMRPEDANRTGMIAHVRASAWENIFDTPVPMKEGKLFSMVFVEKGMIAKLQETTG